jgi:hypothetical protein
MIASERCCRAGKHWLTSSHWTQCDLSSFPESCGLSAKCHTKCGDAVLQDNSHEHSAVPLASIKYLSVYRKTIPLKMYERHGRGECPSKT